MNSKEKEQRILYILLFYTRRLLIINIVNDRQIIGITLWWAEGTKSRRDKRWPKAVTYPIEVTNTDPRIIQIFLDMLRKDIGIDESKLRVQIQIHKGDDQEKLEKYWSLITQLPVSKFNKTIVRPTGNKPGKSNGTCKVRFSDKIVYERLEKLLHEAISSVSGCGAVG